MLIIIGVSSSSHNLIWDLQIYIKLMLAVHDKIITPPDHSVLTLGCPIQYFQKITEANEHAASMRGLSVRKVVMANKMKTKNKNKIC